MNKINIRPGLFLGANELTKWNNFSSDFIKSLVKAFVSNFGVSKSVENSLKIINGTSTNFISIEPGIAIDKYINIIDIPEKLMNHVEVPDDGVTYKIFVKHVSTTLEEGTVDISSNGILSGTGTKFTEVLRGLPGNPVKISFPESVDNIGEYIVSNVTDDTNASISSPMQAESGAKYQVIGSIDRTLPANDNNLYEYNSYEVGIRTFVIDNEIEIGTVTNNSGSITIQDTRDFLTLISNSR